MDDTKSVQQIQYDGFVNILKSLGTNKDARTHSIFQQTRIIDQTQAANLYTENWLAASVVDTPIEDATRKWREFLTEDPEEKAKLDSIMKEAEVKPAFTLATQWAQVFGGSAIVIIMRGDDLEEELIVESIRPDTFERLVVLDRYNIYPEDIERNLLSNNFGKPTYYRVSENGDRIHHSRVIRFLGATSTLRELRQNNYWGSSIFTRMFDPISDSQTTSNAISTLIVESNVDVYGINGLNDLVAESNDELVVKRLEIAHGMKSIVNGIVLDKEDSYDKKTNSFASLADIDDRFIQKVAGASKIPVTKLLGISPAGQNATGESDLRNYYDRVQADQENYFRWRLEYLDRILVKSGLGRDEEFEFKFLPLHQVSETEQATIDKTRADTDNLYLQNGVIEVSDVQANLAKNKTYVALTPERVAETLSFEGNGEDED